MVIGTNDSDNKINHDADRTSSLIGMTLEASPQSNRGYEHSEHPRLLDKQTMDGAQLNLDALYQICPSCFTEAAGEDGKLRHVVDFEKLRALLGDHAVEDAPEVYDFTWVGKRAAQREAMAPCRKTLRPCPEESVNWDTTQNLYIEGDNLEVLKLLQNSYMGKVKMIYIDPPYNTGNDFVYHDDFHRTQREEDEAAGVINEDGERMVKNTESNGKFHSDWCSMMYSRLLVARTLLKNDGVIFISIDDNEDFNLRKICDEVFGEANFVGCICRATGTTTGQDANKIGSSLDYCLVYAKSSLFNILGIELDENDMKRFKDEDERGRYSMLQLRKTGNADRREDRPSMFFSLKAPDGSDVYPFGPTDYLSRWRMGKESVEKLIKDNMLVWKQDDKVKSVIIDGITKSSWTPYVKYYLEGRTKQFSNLLQDIEGNKKASITIKELFGEKGIFDNPKPVEFLTTLLDIVSKDDDIILDFFSGSGTTAHAVMKYNSIKNCGKRFIMIQWPEECDDGTSAYKAGYKNICEIGKERIRRAGKKIKEESPLTTQDLDIGFRVFKCDDSNYKEVAFAPKDYSQESLDLFVDNIKEDRTDLDLLFDCMLRWGVTLDLPMTKTKVDGCTIHNVNEGGLVACFDGRVTEAVIDAIAEMYPAKVVFRDSSFEEDAQKMNLFELFKQKCGWTEQEVKNNVRVI